MIITGNLTAESRQRLTQRLDHEARQALRKIGQVNAGLVGWCDLAEPLGRAADKEVAQPLTWRRIIAAARLESTLLPFALEGDAGEGMTGIIALGINADDQTRVRIELGTRILTHTVRDDAAGFGRRRNDTAARTHAEAVDGAPVGTMMRQRISRSPQVGMLGASAEPGAVDPGLRVLDPHADRKRLGLDMDAAVVQHLECVARTMPDREHDVGGLHHLTGLQHKAAEPPTAISRDFDEQIVDPMLPAIFTTKLLNGGAHMLHHRNQTEGADMGMRLGQYFGRGAGSHEFGQHLATQETRILDLAPQFAVGKGARSPFPELHVRFRIEHAAPPQPPGILGPFAYHLAAIKDDRAEAHLREYQARKQSAGPSADHHRSRTLEIGARAGDEAIFGIGRAPNVWIAAEAIENAPLVRDGYVHRIDHQDCRLASRVVRAPRDREIECQVSRQAEPRADCFAQRFGRMAERQLEFGDAQHGEEALAAFAADRHGPDRSHESIKNRVDKPDVHTAEIGARRRLASMRVAFLFNHDQLHQVAHSLPIALALAELAPQIEVILAPTNPRIQAEVVRLAATRIRGNLSLHPLRICRRRSQYLAALAEPFAPAHKILVYGDNLDFFRSLDLLVVAEKTSLLLKTRYGLDKLKIVHTRHGAGDRAIGFNPASARFDHVLVSGEKIRRRLVQDAGVDPARISVVGYPKFDLHGASRTHAMIDTSRPVVLYNPHVSPHLSSWYKMGRKVLDWFVEHDEYQLIFAPHVMLFERPFALTIDKLRVDRPGRIEERYLRAPNIHIDLGSRASSNMTYTNRADIYLGDVSSQLYEFLLNPRPCVFLDAHDTDWAEDRNYAHWRAGPVINDTALLGAALAEAIRDPGGRYAATQRQLFDESFDLNETPSSVRAARAVARVAGIELPAPLAPVERRIVNA